ncbi:MAG: alpha/beta hydrolase [Alphaproteobacteria bacterium]|nr:alpha/beta hydrolase [Alphaproteobacteria bacterium]HCP00725.1 alpha/beta hydrolase [Rhodospirillaceae bacterium]
MPLTNCGRFNVNYVEEGNGFPIILIHGLAGDHTAWAPHLAAFKDRYRVIAMDNPGSGQSSPVDTPCTTEELADTMIALMDNLGVDNAHVVGRSLGGLIGQHMMLRAPERIQSMVLAASTPKVDRIGKRILENMREVLEWRDSWEDWARHSAHVFVSPAFYNDNTEAIERIEALVGNEARSKTSYVNLNHTALSHDTSDRLSEITCPTLIMAGRQDPICSMQGTDELSVGIADSKTIVFENSSHFFLMEEFDKSMQTLTDWFAEHSP